MPSCHVEIRKKEYIRPLLLARTTRSFFFFFFLDALYTIHSVRRRLIKVYVVAIKKRMKEKKGGKYHINGRTRNLTTGPTNSRYNSPRKKTHCSDDLCAGHVCNISFYLFRQTVWKFCTPIFGGGTFFWAIRHVIDKVSRDRPRDWGFLLCSDPQKKTKIKSDFAQLEEKPKKKPRSQWQVTRIGPWS